MINEFRGDPHRRPLSSLLQRLVGGGSGRPPSPMAVNEPKFRRLRAMKMVEGKVMRNMTNRELADEFRCSVDTVERTLTWAKRADIFASYEDKIVEELIPLAHTAIRDALADGNAKIAVEVFKGLNLLRTGQSAPGTVARAADDDLAAYIAAKRDKAQLLASTIDVTPEEGSHERTTTETPGTPAALSAGSADPAPATSPAPTVGEASREDRFPAAG